ncbi:hflX [Symbiodinium pilosum]|uniref:HflX protein n=1 Tax=Symbiodinium pilosum TaxID=2952 RepID=A0A812WEE5_SYMPI|nr:hflX [Symbiodinium pilosum]
MRGKLGGFYQLLVVAWPLLEILAALDVKDIQVCSLLRHSSDATDACHSDSKMLQRRSSSIRVAGLQDQRVEAIVVFGREDRVRILDTYLQRNLRKNGGVIDKVHFVVFAAMRDDLEYLQQLIEQNAPWYTYPVVTGRRLAKIYSVCNDPDTVYLKIDDDMVYISDQAIAEMVRERLRNRCGLVSANVINHAILSAVHQDIGALRHFFPTDQDTGSMQPWIRNDDALPIMAIEKKSQSQCVWSTWQCAAWMHESFLSRVADGTECAYDFGWHDFHASGHGHFDGSRFLPLPHTRWSINMVAFKAEDVVDAVPEDLAEDDEKELSVVHPARLEKRSCAVGAALAAHFSYSRQEDGLLENTRLLARYQKLAEQVELKA